MADATKSYQVVDRRDDLPIFIHRELDDLGLTPDAFRVYAHLVRRFNTEFNAAWPKVRSMAEICFRSRFPNAQPETLDRKVQRAIRELESFGLLIVESRFEDNRQLSNAYVLTARESWRRRYIPNSDGGGGTAPEGWHRTGGVAPHPKIHYLKIHQEKVHH